MEECPLCGYEPSKVIYYGLPHLFCENGECNCLYGFWSDLTCYLPFNGVLFVYEGYYIVALWKWITGEKGESNEE
ncbi:MAG TPA: hypothetical protein VMV86_02910 [Methanosarcinales archaeon]|nr:hypothetical protein [Methanosarcinales archaeon]